MVSSLIDLLEATPVLVVHLGPDGRVSGVNRRVEQITGLPREQLLGRDWVGTFVAEVARSAARATLEALPSAGSSGVTTYAIVARDAGERAIEWRGRRLCDAAGAAAGVVLVGTDASGERPTGPHARMRGANEKALLATEAALRASQGRFRELFEQALDGIFLLDGDGFFVDANPSGCEMLGYTRDELVGMHGARLSPSGASPMRLAELHAGAHFASERRLLRKDGACVTVEISAQRLADGTILGVARDISEWRRAEEAGAELARRYRMLVDSAPYCIHEVDRDGRVVALNPAGVRMLGVASEAAIRGRPCLDFVAREHRRKYAGHLRSALDGTGSELEFDSIGGLRLHTSFVPLGSTEGRRPDHVMGITLDVTDRRAAEQELRRAKARLVEAHRLANLGAWQLDLRTREVWWSDEQYRLNGVPKGAGPIRQDLFLSLIHPNDRESFAAGFDQTLENGSWEGDYRIVRPDGAIRHVHGIAKIISARAGRPLVMAGTNQDITEHKLAESRLTQSLREKEILLREIHHRVKNNLQIVSSLVHFHARKPESSREQAVFAELGQRLVAMSLVHEKLYRANDLSLVDAGDYLRSLVVALRASCLEAKDVDIRFAADEVSMPMEQALPAGMIACELVTNVLKHAFPGRGRGTASIGLRAEAGRIVLAVDDDGVGFPKGFDPSRDGSFGWELIRALVAQIEGELEATSDGGSHVRVRFSVPSPP